jgi:hypothetical protein
MSESAEQGLRGGFGGDLGVETSEKIAPGIWLADPETFWVLKISANTRILMMGRANQPAGSKNLQASDGATDSSPC